MNLYTYCNNNPIMYYDPTGHIAITTAITPVGVLSGITVMVPQTKKVVAIMAKDDQVIHISPIMFI